MAIAPLLADRDLVVHGEQSARRRGLDLNRNVGDRMRRLKVIVRQDVVPVVSHTSKIDHSARVSNRCRNLPFGVKSRRNLPGAPNRGSWHGRVNPEPTGLPIRL